MLILNLTERQKKILLAIIEEYMKEPQEVGSAQLAKKYNMKVSSATIRNDMVKLMDMGYLDKSHVSSGRFPTDMAFRMFVNECVNSSVKDSLILVKIRQGIFAVRFYPEQMIKKMLDLLVKFTESASFVVLDDMTRYYGISSLMNYEELKDIDSLQRVLDLMEDSDMLKSVFSKYDGEEVTVLIGEELGIEDLLDFTLAFTKINYWDNRVGHIGVVGSRRMDYRVVIPVLNVVRDSVNESLKGWR